MAFWSFWYKVSRSEIVSPWSTYIYTLMFFLYCMPNKTLHILQRVQTMKISWHFGKDKQATHVLHGVYWSPLKRAHFILIKCYTHRCDMLEIYKPVKPFRSLEPEPEQRGIVVDNFLIVECFTYYLFEKGKDGLWFQEWIQIVLLQHFFPFCWLMCYRLIILLAFRLYNLTICVFLRFTFCLYV